MSDPSDFTPTRHAHLFGRKRLVISSIQRDERMPSIWHSASYSTTCSARSAVQVVTSQLHSQTVLNVSLASRLNNAVQALLCSGVVVIDLPAQGIVKLCLGQRIRSGKAQAGEL